jgi:hypothetical protein
MDANSHLAYVQARLQARHGDRLSPSEWQVLESARDIASFLQSARATHLRRWIDYLPADVDPHLIESSLRNDWKDYVAEIASWVAGEWQPAVGWMATLVDLPAIVHLSRGCSVRRWMREDPAFAPYAIDDPGPRAELLRANELGAAMAALRPGDKPLAVWLEHWRTLQPAAGPKLRSLLDQFSRLLLRHLHPEIEPGSQPRTGARVGLSQDLERHFRNSSGTIAAAFVHIGLMLLCWERLRAGLLLRTLVPEASGRPQWA